MSRHVLLHRAAGVRSGATTAASVIGKPAPAARELHSTSPTQASMNKARPEKMSAAQKAARQVKAPKVNMFAPPKNPNWSIYSFDKTVELVNERNARKADAQLNMKPMGAVDKDELVPAAVMFGETESAETRVAFYAPKTVDYLEKLGAVYPKQYFNLFSEAATIIRKESTELHAFLKAAKESTPATATSVLLTGAAGSGKSVVLQQAIAFAQKEGYFVLHFPDAEDLVDGWVDFKAPEDGAESTLYDQPMYLRRLMRRIADANGLLEREQVVPTKKGKKVAEAAPITDGPNLNFKTVTSPLSSAKLTKSYEFRFGRRDVVTLKAGQNSIVDLIRLAASNTRNAVPGFKYLIDELMVEREVKIPILLSVDNISALAEQYYTAYRDTEYQRLRYTEFFLPKLLIDFISGSRKFPTGMTLAAVSGPRSSLTMKHVFGTAAPYAYMDPVKTKYDPALVSALSAAHAIPIAPFSLQESDALLRYYRAAGVLNDIRAEEQKFVTARSVVEKRFHALQDSKSVNFARQLLPKIKAEHDLLGRIASDAAAPFVVKAHGLKLHSASILGSATALAEASVNSAGATATAAVSSDAASTVPGASIATVGTPTSSQRIGKNETGTLFDTFASSSTSPTPSTTAASTSSSAVNLPSGLSEATVRAVIDERKSQFWARFVAWKWAASGNGNPRALMTSCLFPLL
ncbi:mitochondrial 37S ribosomal mS29 domain-containing protein [Limtongia smithiae]|uniref:mitochondrial 37S ribosomal mS29 domain-containing protein n=1 Tax=Limtongia smithiae TaxID=1125753 RepID=UPI0034CEB457